MISVFKKLKKWSESKNKSGVLTPLWRALLFEHRLPWRYNQGRFLNTVLFRPLRLFYLPLILWFYNLNKKEDITVVIGIKNKFDYKIKNTFKSIRNQDYPKKLIKIVLVDYDSDPSLIEKYKKICREYNMYYIRVNNKPEWNRSHCLNVGIKKTKTKYTLTSDVDIIFEKNYIKNAIEELQKNPFQVILSKCFDLPNLQKNKIAKLNLNKLRSLAKVRFKGGYNNPGINLTLTYFYHKIRGYDEEYKLWGGEDNNLIKRFELFGLNIKSIKNKSVYLHQWHPRYEGVKKIKGYEKQIKKNREYFKNTNSIIYNKDKWGEIK